MKIQEISAVNFRNLADVSITPCEGMNILYGDNAHGKTNLLEAIWMLTGGKSFRGSKDSELVRFGQPKAFIKATFFGRGREQTASMTVETRRTAELNGIRQASPKKLTGQFCAVIFSPDHLSLIKDGPEERRKFLDAAICQTRPLYMNVLGEYNRIVKQRNQWIKAVKNGEQAADDLLMDALDERMAMSGATVRQYRTAYIKELIPFVEEFYEGLSKDREHLSLSMNEDSDAQTLLRQIKAARMQDKKAGFSTVGPHRDDLFVTINGNAARAFGSQGQQRSAVLALKLAEAALLAREYNEKPIILLDDVMSELDLSRQEYILNHIDGFQVFITCCDPASITRLTDGVVFHIENGAVTSCSV